MEDVSRKTWWGEYRLETGQSAEWRIGPLHIGVQRLPREWIVAYERDEAENGGDEWHFTYGSRDLGQGTFAEVMRYASQSTTDLLKVLPALADRSVVTRPMTSFTVPAGERTSIFVSTPLWLAILTGDPPNLLAELPIRRPSDTWFGSSTREGETCYASRSYSRLNLENVSIHPHRAVTQVNILNKAEIPLLIERLNLPVPYLSLFANPEGALWTETITMARTGEAAMAEFSIEKSLPPAAAGAHQIARPRMAPSKSMLVRAFSALTMQAFD